MLDLEPFKGLWDALTGVGTLALAISTFIVILQGRAERRDTERRHRDSLRPICTLMPYTGVDPAVGRGTLLDVQVDMPVPGFGTVTLGCTLRNIGPGPALNVRLMFRLYDLGHTTWPWELGPLGVGESRGSEAAPLRIPIQFLAPLEKQDFVQFPGHPWEIILVYEDVFGNQFHTVHRKNPLQLNRLSAIKGSTQFYAPPQRWTILGVGEAPALSGETLAIGFAPAARRWRLPQWFRTALSRRKSH